MRQTLELVPPFPLVAEGKIPNCMRCGADRFIELPYRIAAGVAPYLLLCCAGCLGVVSGARTGEAMDRPLALWKPGFDPDWAQRAEGANPDKAKRSPQRKA
ncbi:MAG TPA: hypothetical protein VM286_03540 [Candidatus Thermoplasmatota archaeon]|nr:hypothetical protein [Candidatus Thermoplasmatota archaeon]